MALDCNFLEIFLVFASLMDSVKLNSWEKCTGYHHTVYTLQVFEGPDIRILLHFDDVTRFEEEANVKYSVAFSTFVGILLVYADFNDSPYIHNIIQHNVL